MSALIVLVLSGTACCLISLHRQAWPVVPRRNSVRSRASARRSGPHEEALPRLIRQLASLLAAGRTGPLLWRALALVLTVEQNRSREQARTPSPESIQLAPRRHGPLPAWERVQMDVTLQLVLTVERASALGLPTAPAVRSACSNFAGVGRGGFGRSARRGGLTSEQVRVWLDIAACFDVCEASGAPVAAVLERLATMLEADHDAAALRETALAGPRATVKLLTWLPFLGLGLGMLMGVDPMAALLGSPLGWAVVAAGTGFAVAGRAWSASMIANAARPIEGSDGRRKSGNGSRWHVSLARRD